MKLGEIKAEALSLMFTDISIVNDIKQLNDSLLLLRDDPNYRSYMNAMPGAINRCFSSLENKGILPTKIIEIPSGDIESVGPLLRLSISKSIPQAFKIDSISFFAAKIFRQHIEYSMQDSDTFVFEPQGNGVYIFEYTPKIERILSITSEDKEIDLPDDIACLIPYFIKSELFREDNASEASTARNIYESMCEELYDRRSTQQSSVHNEYFML